MSGGFTHRLRRRVSQQPVGQPLTRDEHYVFKGGEVASRVACQGSTRSFAAKRRYPAGGFQSGRSCPLARAATVPYAVRLLGTRQGARMKIVRFLDPAGKVTLGEPVDARTAKRLRGDLFGTLERTDETVSIAKVLPPVDPPNLFAIGLNYRAHAAEGGFPIPDEPLVFLKATTCVIAAGEPIVLPASAPDEVDYEAELAIVIGKTCRKVSEADAPGYVLGYTCANDVSARDCQVRRDKQWARAKSFDTFCPLGPALVTADVINPDDRPIRSLLNGKVMQDSNTSDLIFSTARLISYLSHQFTLRPGTVIVTGTPSGVGVARKPPVFLRPGDTIVVQIDGIGELSNPVVADT
jgi:2-keto-4-pentenoate hydratase/2-oxohepta-3-ene-1,7-dioic acid hydratase in catechol pathway